MTTRLQRPHAKVLLMILDGWGIGKKDAADMIYQGQPVYLEGLQKRYPHAQLRTDGHHVGLPDGQMGNSEVGHLNIGAGRVVYQDYVKINRAFEDGSIRALPAYQRLVDVGQTRPVHLMGLLSHGGVHSALNHILAMVDALKADGVSQIYLHGFMDGRDTDPKAGLGFVQETLEHLAPYGDSAQLVTLVGRYYAMDRDKRWERVAVAYNALTQGEGQAVTDWLAAIATHYEAGTTDEFMPAMVKVDHTHAPVGRIQEGDAVVFMNFRNDRAKELTYVLTQAPVEAMTPLKLHYTTLTPYDPTYQGVHVLFNKENVADTLGEVVSQAGLRQLRIAETEKYAHVTFFFSGGQEAPFAGEERILIASPKVATYDLKPEMSAYEVADALSQALASETFGFICLNFANGDMVGHTGVATAIQQAVKAVDACAQKVIETAVAHGYEVVQIADHGNADHAVNANGSPNTAHSLNPVPIVVVSDRVQSVRDGVLADVAPTILDLMGLTAPTAMTGQSLVTFK